MLDRELKAIFTGLLGLMALLYVAHNILNLAAAYEQIGAVVGLENNSIFPVNILPGIGSPLSMAVAWIIFLFEIATAFFLFFGAAKLWKHRKLKSEDYRNALGTAKLGAAFAIFTWFGLFGVFGGAGYQMWQHEIGSGSLSEAFKFSVWAFLLLIYLGQPERAPDA